MFQRPLLNLFICFICFPLIGTKALACGCTINRPPAGGDNYWAYCYSEIIVTQDTCTLKDYCKKCVALVGYDEPEACYEYFEAGGTISCVTPNYFGIAVVEPVTTVNNSKKQCGSVIKVNEMVVGESIPITGTNQTLNYFSDRVAGKKGLYHYSQHIHDGTGTANLAKIHVTHTWQGVDNTVIYDPPSTVEDFVFDWDGEDLLGNTPIASQVSKIKVDFELTDSSLVWMFDYSTPVGTYQAKAIGLGGWTLSNVHFYEPNRKILYYGNGETHRVEAFKVDIHETTDEVEKLFSSTNEFSHYMVIKPDKTEAYIFDPNGYHVETRSTRTNEVFTKIHWDVDGLLESVEDAFGNEIEILRSGSTVTIVAPNSKETQILLNPEGWASEVTDPMNKKYEMTYNTSGLLLSFENPEGLISSFEYDSDGNLEKDSNSAGHETVLSFLSNIPGVSTSIKSVSKLGRTTRYNTTYQSNGTTQQNVVAPSGATTSYNHLSYNEHVYTPEGYQYSENKSFDPRFEDQARYVSSKNITSGYSSHYVGHSYSTSAASTNILTLNSESYSTSYQGKTWTKNYNGSLGEYIFKTPLLRESKLKLNDYDQVIEEQFASFTPTEYTYDVKGRLSEMAQGVREWTLTYNTDHQVASITNPKSEVTSYIYDNNGRVTESTLGNGDKVYYSYDDNGNLTGIKAGSKPWHEFIVSSWNSILSYVFPSIASEVHEIEYEYNLDKQLTKVTKPGNIEIEYNYNLTTGLLGSITTPEGLYSSTYNSYEQVTALASPSFANISYTYNSDQLLKQSLVHNLLTTETIYTYSQLRKTSQKITSIDSDSNEQSTIAYGFDDDRLLISAGDLDLTRSLTTGLIEEVSLGTNMLETYDYDSSFGELSEMQAKYSTTNILKEEYTRDTLGRISDMEETVGTSSSDTYTYEYDARGRLFKVYKNSSLQRHYFYDVNSNRLKIEDGSSNVLVSATYDNQDRVTSYGDSTFAYTDYGHRSEKLNTVSNIKESLVYDSMGALVSFEKENTSTSTTLMSINYVNDGMGRRILKIKDSVPEKRYIYDEGIRLIGEVTPDGDTLTHYVYGDKGHVPSYMIRGLNKYKIVTNAQGSVRFVVNESTGVIEQEMTYDEFGQVLSDSNPGFQAFGFAGGIYESDTGLVRFGARDYDAETGRWTSKDPILFGGGDTNLYGYALQDPVNLIDPNGRDSEIIVYDYGHAVLRVDDPSSSTGSSYIDFYPLSLPWWPFLSAEGALDITDSYSGTKRFSYNQCKSSPEEDRQILERANNFSKQLQEGKIKYNPFFRFGSRHQCHSAARLIQGGC